MCMPGRVRDATDCGPEQYWFSRSPCMPLHDSHWEQRANFRVQRTRHTDVLQQRTPYHWQYDTLLPHSYLSNS